LIFQLFSYSGGTTQGINLSNPISPTNLSLIGSRMSVTSSASRLPTTLRWATTTTTAASIAESNASSAASSSAYIQGIEENMAGYDPEMMSPMLTASNGGEGGPGGGGHGGADQGHIMDDGENETVLFAILKSNHPTCYFSYTNANYFLATDRYFQCEPMDATVSPIALTSHSSVGTSSSSSSSGRQPPPHRSPLQPLGEVETVAAREEPV
jgi:hypothetical protein